MSLTASDDVITSSVVSSDVIDSLVIADDVVYAEKENDKLVTSSANVVMTSAKNSDTVNSLSSFDDVTKPDVKRKLVRQVAKQISTSSTEEGITKQMSCESAPPGRRMSCGSSTSSLKFKTSISDHGNFFLLASSNRASMTSSFTDSSSSREHLDVEKVRVIPGHETLIELNKGVNGLGISIVGGRDSLLNCILVHTVYQEGAAAIDGRLWPGDRILAVNGQDISDSTHDEAIDVLWKTSGRVSLLIVRDEHREQIDKEEDEDVYDIHTVSLFKQPNKGLGLSIIARRNHPGVYISNLISGGVAKKQGSLKKGDHILSINGNDVKFASQDTVASILKNVRDEVVIRVGRLKGGLLPPELTEVAPKMLLNQPDVYLSEELVLSYTSKDREENQTRFVEIHKSKLQPLGITIAGGLNSPLGNVPIFIVMIQQQGAAASQLKIGDVILSVNGRSTDHKTHDEVVMMLKGTDDTIVLMQVRDGGEEVEKLTSYLNEASSSINQLVSSWDSSVSERFEESDKDPIDVEIRKGSEGLGLSITGGYGSPHGNIPIFIKHVSPGGAAASEGLKRGDQILSVNGEDLNGYTHEEAAEALRRKSHLLILRVIPS